MTKGKAFVVVGHEDWGKSRTIKALTNGSTHKQKIIIGDKAFKIRRMSNDDVPVSLIKFLAENCPKDTPYIIITLCPNFEDAERWTAPILEFLWFRYEIYFWVIQKKYKSDEQIDKHEISKLRKFGKVEVFDEQVESGIRARTFKSFVESNL